jgi:CheY-like chemotaxis protein
MAARRISVFDNDSAFADLLQNTLGLYGIEVRRDEMGTDDFQAFKAAPPDVVFISADWPDNAGYTLCSTIRKTLGNSISIVMTTALLSPYDLSLHEKQRLHADLYLDKRNLSPEIIIEKINALIDLGPRIGSPSMEKEEDRFMTHDEGSQPLTITDVSAEGEMVHANDGRKSSLDEDSLETDSIVT